MRALFFTIFVSLFLSGCAQKESATHIKEHAIFIEKSPITTGARKSAKTIKIKVANSSSLYTRDDMWYKSGSEFASFAKNRWAISPNEQVAKIALYALEDSGSFTSVSNISSSAPSEFTLELSVVDFYQDFSADSSYVIVEIRANFISNKNSAIVESKKFSYKQKSNSNTPYAGLDTYTHIMQGFYEELRNWKNHF